ncbi:hypothetical protein HDV01_007422 [Terramyces sp. JEL0728]|nr:hypothetical protein HDV01_007422 [Terramyces sp. JEL0728]
MKSDAEADVDIGEEETKQEEVKETKMEVDKVPEPETNENDGDVKINVPKDEQTDEMDDTGLSLQKPVSHEQAPVKKEDLQILRSMWQFSAISQFFQLFQEGMMLGFIDTDTLESEIINATSDSWIIDLQVRLLRLSTKNRFITYPAVNSRPETWIGYLTKEFEKRMTEEERPFNHLDDETLSYTKLTLRERVLTLHFICEIQLERLENFRPLGLFTEIQTTSWRVEPIGKDSKGNIYWLFDDSRLYMESPEASKKKKGKKEKEDEERPTNWSLVCRTAEDWNEFASKFKSSRSALDKQLHRYVNQDLLPLVITDIYNHQVAKEDREKEYKAWLEAENVRIEEEERQEALRIVEEEEKKREAVEMTARKTRSANRIETRASRRNPPRELTEEELELQKLGARELRRVQRESRIDRNIIEESISYAEPKRPKKKKKPAKKKRSQVYDSEEEEDLTEEDDDESFVNSESPPPDKEDDYWYFSCPCGITGDNYDDGTPIIACERCAVWQHILCAAKEQGVDTTMLDVDEWKKMEFICTGCLPKPKKVKLNKEGSNSPEKTKNSGVEQAYVGFGNGPQIQQETPTGYHLGITVDPIIPPVSPTVHGSADIQGYVPSQNYYNGNGYYPPVVQNVNGTILTPRSPSKQPVSVQPISPGKQATMPPQNTNYNPAKFVSSHTNQPSLVPKSSVPPLPNQTMHPTVGQYKPSSPIKSAPSVSRYQPLSPGKQTSIYHPPQVQMSIGQTKTTPPYHQPPVPVYSSSPNNAAGIYTQTGYSQPSTQINYQTNPGNPYSQQIKPPSPQRTQPATNSINRNPNQMPAGIHNSPSPNINSPKKDLHNNGQQNNENPLMSLVAAIHSNENE